MRNTVLAVVALESGRYGASRVVRQTRIYRQHCRPPLQRTQGLGHTLWLPDKLRANADFLRRGMKRFRSNVAFNLVGLATLIVTMSALMGAQTADSAKVPNQPQSSTKSSAPTKNGKAGSQKPGTGSSATAPRPASARAADAPPPAGATLQIAPPGWVPQNPPGQPDAQQAGATPSQKKATSATKPHPKTTKPANTSTPKS